MLAKCEIGTFLNMLTIKAIECHVPGRFKLSLQPSVIKNS